MPLPHAGKKKTRNPPLRGRHVRDSDTAARARPSGLELSLQWSKSLAGHSAGETPRWELPDSRNGEVRQRCPADPQLTCSTPLLRLGTEPPEAARPSRESRRLPRGLPALRFSVFQGNGANTPVQGDGKAGGVSAIGPTFVNLNSIVGVRSRRSVPRSCP
jgi:hypothetical protein